MGIEARWADSRTLVIEFHPGWTWDHLYLVGQETDNMIGSASHRVDMLIDIRRAGGLPRDFLNQAGNLLNQGDARPNEGEKVIVGANWLIRTAYQGFLQVYGSRVESRPLRFAASMDEARQILEQSQTP